MHQSIDVIILKVLHDVAADDVFKQFETDTG